MIVLDVLTGVLLTAALFFFVSGTVGLLRFPDLYSRLHALTKADNVGLGLAVLALMLQAESWSEVFRLGLIWVLVLTASATVCFLKSETNSAFVEKLARKAPCSVMVLPPGRSLAYRRVLVTTDFSAAFMLTGSPAVISRPASRGDGSERNWSLGRRIATENSKRRSTGADSRQLLPPGKVRWRRGRYSDRPRSSGAICS